MEDRQDLKQLLEGGPGGYFWDQDPGSGVRRRKATLGDDKEPSGLLTQPLALPHNLAVINPRTARCCGFRVYPCPKRS
ncbi:hypothetical protein MTBLM1_90069 [Rhodospirillaceae bacterium LM-1]|nr:hypothetical protein MTBLM1_90069 [Rhodospirillaceae bacterium LM-1]